MDTEYDFGWEYAKWCQKNGLSTGQVGIDQMLSSTMDVPESDYVKMRSSGIKNPDTLKYWSGYNAYFVHSKR